MCGYVRDATMCSETLYMQFEISHCAIYILFESRTDQYQTLYEIDLRSQRFFLFPKVKT